MLELNLDLLRCLYEDDEDDKDEDGLLAERASGLQVDSAFFGNVEPPAFKELEDLLDSKAVFEAVLKLLSLPVVEALFCKDEEVLV